MLAHNFSTLWSFSIRLYQARVRKKHTWIFRCKISSIIFYYGSTKWQNLYHSFGCLWHEKNPGLLSQTQKDPDYFKQNTYFCSKTQNDLDSFAGKNPDWFCYLVNMISVTINIWKHKPEFSSHSSLYQNYLWVYWLTEGNVACFNFVEPLLHYKSIESSELKNDINYLELQNYI